MNIMSDDDSPISPIKISSKKKNMFKYGLSTLPALRKRQRNDIIIVIILMSGSVYALLLL